MRGRRMKKIIIYAATLAFYGVALGNLIASISDSNTYYLGLAILNYLIAMNLEKRYEVEDGNGD